jgi:hypothetical protein
LKFTGQRSAKHRSERASPFMQKAAIDRRPTAIFTSGSIRNYAMPM